MSDLIRDFDGDKEWTSPLICKNGRPIDVVDREEKTIRRAIDVVSEMAVEFTYVNYRGETSVRRVLPNMISYCYSSWHGETWHLHAYDLEKQEMRSFAMKHISNWKPINNE